MSRLSMRPAAVGIVWTLLLATLLLGACGSSPDGATGSGPSGGSAGSGGSSDSGAARTPQLADLTGGTWVADSVTSPEHQLVKGSTIVLTFTDDSIAVNAGCNSMHGSASITDGTLVVGTLASTMMACDDALSQQDHWIQGFLTSRPAIEMVGEDLRLSKGSTTIQFVHHA